MLVLLLSVRIKKLKQQDTTEHRQGLNPVTKEGNALESNIKSRPEQDMKPAVLSMQNKTQLFKPVKIDVWAHLCIFTDTILSVFCAKDLLFNQG